LPRPTGASYRVGSTLCEGLWIFRIANPLGFLSQRKVASVEGSSVVYS